MRRFTNLTSLARSGVGSNSEWGDPMSVFTGMGYPEMVDATSLRTGIPLLSIYYTGDDPDISISGNSFELVHDGDTATVPFSGKTCSEIASMINRLGMPYTCNVLYESDEIVTLSPFVLGSSDKTIDGGYIVRGKGHVVKPLEEAQIRVLPPYNSNRFEPWHVVINKGWVTRRYKGGDWRFAVPEYEDQTWSVLYGRGFVDLKDIVGTFVGPRAISVPRTPIHWDRGNLQLRVRDITQSSDTVKDVDVHNGIIYLNRDYDANERIVVDYTYKEDGYLYSVADINPTEFHSPGSMGRYIVYYLLPYIGPDGPIRSSCVRHSESSTLSGAIYSIPNTGEPILLLGATQVRQVNDSDEVQITDTRTRGGGVKDNEFKKAVTQNREILNTADHTFYDGHPYPGNMSLFVTLPEEVKAVLEKAEIEGVIKRFMAYGTYTFIDFE